MWRPWKLSNFQDPPPPLSSYVQLCLLPPWPWTPNFKRTPLPLQIVANQLKENITQGWLLYLSGLSFRSAFVFSIDSSRLVFHWLLCIELKPILSPEQFYFQVFLVLILQSTCFICITSKGKQIMEQQPCEWRKSNKNKQNMSRHIQIDHALYCSI